MGTRASISVSVRRRTESVLRVVGVSMRVETKAKRVSE